MPATVLVTGASGFVGSHLLDRLTRQSTTIEAWKRPESAQTHRSTYLRTFKSNQVRWHSIDILDVNTVEKAIDQLRPSIIYHCAGAAHVADSWRNNHQTLKVNVLGTENLFNAVYKADVKPRIFIPGSAMVYRHSVNAIDENAQIQPTNPYALSKIAQEMLGTYAIEQNGLDILLTRSFTHLGPRQNWSYAASGFAYQIARIEIGGADPILAVGNLDARRDLTDVRDTVRAYELLMKKGVPGRIYNVCSGLTHRIGDLLEQLLSHAQVPVKVQVEKSRLRPNDNPLLLGNPSRIQIELGWEPQIPISQTLQDLLQYWRTTIAASSKTF